MLDAMAERGVWFPTCLTLQPLTLPSHTSIMTGLYPFSHGVRNNGTYIVPDETVTLAERLQEEGYATHAVVSAFVLDSQFGLDQGFAGYDDDFSGGPKQKMFMFKEIKADAVARKAVRWLEQERSKEKPFFLWLHFFDPHADYEPPADPTELKDLYGAGNVPGEMDRLAKDLGGMVEADPFTRGEQRPDELSGETRDKLAVLGYVWTATESEATGPRPDPKDRIVYWEQFQESQKLMREGEFEAAVAAIRELLSEDPDNVVAMGFLANALARTGHDDEALEVYRRMMALDPHRETSYLGSAKILREQGRFDEAADLVRAAIEMQPNDPQGHTALGDTFLEQGRFVEAEQHFRKALEIDPHSMLAASGLGNCLNRVGRLDEALELLTAARAHDPSSHAVTYNLAVVTERKGDQPAALALYREAIELEPEHSMSWNNLGSLMDRLGNRKQALEYVAKGQELDPENVEATYNLGRTPVFDRQA